MAIPAIPIFQLSSPPLLRNCLTQLLHIRADDREAFLTSITFHSHSSYFPLYSWGIHFSDMHLNTGYLYLANPFLGKCLTLVALSFLLHGHKLAVSHYSYCQMLCRFLRLPSKCCCVLRPCTSSSFMHQLSLP